MSARCFICGRYFRDSSAARRHQYDKHQHHPDRDKIAPPVRDDDESYADIAVETAVKRASGERLDPIEEALQP